MERKAIVSRMKLSPSTKAKTIGSQLADQIEVVDVLGRLTGHEHACLGAR